MSTGYWIALASCNCHLYTPITLADCFPIGIKYQQLIHLLRYSLTNRLLFNREISDIADDADDFDYEGVAKVRLNGV